MIGLTLIAIPILYMLCFVVAGTKIHSWYGRIAVWVLLSIPPVLWLWDFPVIAYRNDQACMQDGGARVIVPIEKTNRILLDRKSYSGSFPGNKMVAEAVLTTFYPHIQVVEAGPEHEDPDGQYYAYSVDPSSAESGPRNYKFVRSPIEHTTSGIYTISKAKESTTSGGFKNQLILSRRGQITATWTWYRATWNPYGVLPHTWSCFTQPTPEYALASLITN